VSVPELVTLDDLAEVDAGGLSRDSVLRDLAVAPGFAYHLGETAREVGRIRCRAEPDSSLAYLGERLASHVEGLWLLEAPTAANYVAAGLDVDDALEIVDRHVGELNARMGGRP
jgi:hypothetical protein